MSSTVAALLCLLSAAVITAAHDSLHIDACHAAGGRGHTYTVPANTYSTINVSNIEGCSVAAGSDVIVEGRAFFSAPRENGTLTISGGRYGAVWVGDTTSTNTTSSLEGTTSRITIYGATIAMDASVIAAVDGLSTALRVPPVLESLGVVIKHTAITVIAASGTAIDGPLSGVTCANAGAPGADITFSNVSVQIDANITAGASSVPPTITGVAVDRKNSTTKGIGSGKVLMTSSRVVVRVASSAAALKTVAGVRYAAVGANTTVGLFMDHTTVDVSAVATVPTVSGASAAALSLPLFDPYMPLSTFTAAPMLSVLDSTLHASTAGGAIACRDSQPSAWGVAFQPLFADAYMSNPPMTVRRSGITVEAKNGAAFGLETIHVPFVLQGIMGASLIEGSTIDAKGLMCPGPAPSAQTTVAAGVQVNLLGGNLSLQDTTVNVASLGLKGRVLGVVAASPSTPGALLISNGSSIAVGNSAAVSDVEQGAGVWLSGDTAPPMFLAANSAVAVAANAGAGVQIDIGRASSLLVELVDVDVTVKAGPSAAGIVFSGIGFPFFAGSVRIAGGTVDVTCDRNGGSSDCTGIVAPVLLSRYGHTTFVRIAPGTLKVSAVRAAGVSLVGEQCRAVDVTVAPTSLTVLGAAAAVGVNVSLSATFYGDDGHDVAISVALPSAVIDFGPTFERLDHTVIWVLAPPAINNVSIRIGDVSSKGVGFVLHTAQELRVQGATATSRLSVHDDGVVLSNTRRYPQAARPGPPPAATMRLEGFSISLTGVNTVSAVATVSESLNVTLSDMTIDATLPRGGSALQMASQDIALRVSRSTMSVVCAEGSLQCTAMHARVPVTRPVTFTDSRIVAESGGALVDLFSLSSTVTFTNTQLNYSTSRNDAVAMTKVGRNSGTASTVRFHGGSIHLSAPAARHATVLAGAASVVFAGSFAAEPSHVGQPVTVTVNGSTPLSLVALPSHPAGPSLWANVAGPPHMELFGNPGVPQTCSVPIGGPSTACSVTLVNESTVHVPTDAQVFADPETASGFTLGVWSLPIYTTRFDGTPVPTTDNFTAHVATFAGVPESSVRVWFHGRNVSFVVDGPESQNAYHALADSSATFSSQFGTSALVVSGGGMVGGVQSKSPDSVPVWAIAAGVGVVVVVAVTVAAVIAWRVTRRSATTASIEETALVDERHAQKTVEA